MPESESRLTVYFDPPFWVGIYERINNGCMEAAKITFGAEPKDYEVYDYLLKHWASLRFSPSVPVSKTTSHIQNPKRTQRAIKEQLTRHGSSTKSQEALALQRDANKTERQIRSRKAKETEKSRQFILRQEKRKEKHRGH